MERSRDRTWVRLTLCSAALLLGSEVASAQAPPPPPPPAQGELALMLFDLSGSMLDGAADGRPKVDVAIERAHQFLDEVRTNREYSLWTFTNSGATEVINFSQRATASQVRAEIDKMASRIAGATPFAGSFCDAVDHLILTQDQRDRNLPPGIPPIIYEKRIAVYTDGLENNTPMTHPCWGPRSIADQPWTEVDSWQYHIFNKASTGRHNVPPAPGLPATVIADVSMIFESFIPSQFRVTLSAAAPFASAVPVLPQIPSHVDQVNKKLIITPDIISDLQRGGAISPIAGTVVMPISNIIKTEDLIAIQSYTGISQRTGGEYRSISSLKDIPITGDANGDRCVNSLDHEIVMKQYGKNVGYNAPEDLNRDRTVNYSDYLTLLQNWNDGC